jgi:hypothetical protein
VTNYPKYTVAFDPETQLRRPLYNVPGCDEINFKDSIKISI